MVRIPKSAGSGNISRRLDENNLKAAREYLAALEALAHMGRASEDPTEVTVALVTFARPSAFLKQLAGVAA